MILCKYSHSTNPDYGDPTEYYTVASDFIKKDEKFVSGLYEALRQDIIDNKNYYNIVAPVWTTDPTVSIGDSFMSINVSYDVNNDYYGKIPDGVETDDLYVTIPNTYTRTINYLNQNGIDTSITETEENHEYVELTYPLRAEEWNPLFRLHALSHTSSVFPPFAIPFP